ncbi:hypothetical protein CSUI_006674, partial [Cystoisospora suis]
RQRAPRSTDSQHGVVNGCLVHEVAHHQAGVSVACENPRAACPTAVSCVFYEGGRGVTSD